MIIPLSEIDKCFEKILKKSINGSVTVAILVGPDVDSICAALILVSLLKYENILYKIFPLSGYTELDNIVEELKSFQNLKSLIFLNVGAIIDLTEKWFATEEQKITVYVFDCHRPIHHNNVNCSKKIVLIDDYYCNIEECPTKEDMEIGDEEEDEEDDDENMYGEEEEEEEKEEGNRQEGDEEEEEIEIGKKRKTKIILEKKLKKKLKLERRIKIQTYYRGHYYGRSTACVMFCLASQLNKDSNEYIWWAILGLTDLLIHDKISYNLYQEMVLDLHNYVLKLNALDYERDRNVENEINENNIQNDTDNLVLDTDNKAIGKIFIENDFRLMLLRHWTLYDSMYYSSYLAPRLRIWSEFGKKELTRFIALIGIPLEEARQKYKYMNSQLKIKLKDLICQVGAEKFELHDILFNSFTKQIDSKLQISATDMVHCVNAILTFSKILKNEKIEGLFENEEQKTNSQGLPEKTEENKNKNFWWAYDLLKSENSTLILQGIDMAIEFQKSLMSEAIFMIEKKSIIPCSEFRYALINSDTLLEKKFFSHPLALQKLSLFLMEIYKIQKNEKVSKPMILCLLNKIKNTYMVVGVAGSSSHYSNNRNDFGYKFVNAAEKSHTKIRHDDFETSIIEITKEDFFTFLEELTSNK